jgi:hypothetical protein
MRAREEIILNTLGENAEAAIKIGVCPMCFKVMAKEFLRIIKERDAAIADLKDAEMDEKDYEDLIRACYFHMEPWLYDLLIEESKKRTQWSRESEWGGSVG